MAIGVLYRSWFIRTVSLRTPTRSFHSKLLHDGSAYRKLSRRRRAASGPTEVGDDRRRLRSRGPPGKGIAPSRPSVLSLRGLAKDVGSPGSSERMTPSKRHKR